MRASAGRGVRRATIPIVVISRPVGIAVVVAPVAIKSMLPPVQSGGEILHTS